MKYERILVWDWPVRLGHWLMVIAFIVCWLSSESERLQAIHIAAGATLIAAASFRLLWGVLGTRHARFSSFVRGRTAVTHYMSSLLRLETQHHTGHNPAGGWAIIALLALGLLTGLSGWATLEEFGGHWLEELHEGLAASMLAVVVIHVAGVALGSLLHGENLVRAMIDGHKLGQPSEAILSPRPLVAIVLLAWIGVVGYLLLNC